MLRWAPYPSAGIVRIRFKGTADRIRISGSGPPLGSADTISGAGVECELLIAGCQRHRVMFRSINVPASRREPHCPQTSRDDGPDRGERLLLDAAARFPHESDPRGERLLLRADPGRSARPRVPSRRDTRFRNPGLRARWDGQSVHADHVVPLLFFQTLAKDSRANQHRRARPTTCPRIVLSRMTTPQNVRQGPCAALFPRSGHDLSTPTLTLHVSPMPASRCLCQCVPAQCDHLGSCVRVACQETSIYQ